MIIALTPTDALNPAMVGMRRQLFALQQRLRHHGTGCDESLSFDHHILGAMAEFAVARALNLFWEPHVGMIKGADVGGMVEVRLRRIPGTGSDLAIRNKDHDDRPHVLVHNRGDLTFTLVGWLYGRDGKGIGVFNDRNEVWFVPPPYRPIDELITMLHGIVPMTQAAE